MSDKPPAPEDFTALMGQWAQMWSDGAAKAGEMGKAMEAGNAFQSGSVWNFGKAWMESALPQMAGRILEGPGFGGGEGGNQMSEAIERMAQGPRLADVWDMDRKLYAAMAAWMEMRQSLAAYSAVAATPWKRAMDRYGEGAADEAERDDWRKAFARWSGIANEEMIKNQRSDEFLAAQRELLRTGLEFRARQQALTETFAAFLNLPTQQDFDAVTQQLTELRRELRTHARSKDAHGLAPVKPAATAAAATMPAPKTKSKIKSKIKSKSKSKAKPPAAKARKRRRA